MLLSFRFKANRERAESQRIELHLQHVLLGIGNIQQGHSDNQDLLNRTISYLSKQEQPLEAVQQRVQQYTIGTHPPLLGGSNFMDTSSIMPPPSAHTTFSLPSSPPPLPAGYSATVNLQLARRRRCKFTCICSCHRKSFHKAPYFFRDILGSLFIGYTGVPIFSEPCNTKKCQAALGTNFQVLYVFPSWLLSWAICTTVAFTETKGPELVLRCLRIRPQGSQIFQSVLQGSLYTMSLIVAGSGSVLDIDEDGRSITTVCVMDPFHLRILHF